MAELDEPLSDRELAVLEQLLDGSTNREIALELDISPNTVKVHLRNIFTKLGVSSRTEATTVALQKGLLSVPGMLGASAGYQADTPVAAPLPSATATTESEDGPAMTAPTRQWLWLVVGLLIIVGLIISALAGSWLARNDGATAESPVTTEEPFVDAPVGESNWLVGRPLIRERANMALTSVGLDLYLIGGEVEAGVVNLVDVYETDSRQWRTAASKPTAVANTSAAVLFGEIYVPGGRLADGQPTAVVEAYSPAHGAWRPIAPLPQPVAGGVALTDGSLLYLFGGWDGERYLADGFVYDPSTDSWRDLPPMKQGRVDATGGVSANRFYVVGGFDGETELAICESFDPAANTWSDCPEMLAARAGAGATVLGNKLLYVLGGGLEDDVVYGEVYDPRDDSWQQVEMPMLDQDLAWYDLGVTSVETRIYAIGGRSEGEILSEIYIFMPFIHRTFLPTVGDE